MVRSPSPAFRSAIVTAALVAALVAAPFSERVSAQSAATAADEAAIAEFNRKYLKAINDGDIDSLASLTTDGHMMIMSGGPPLTGKHALVDAMARAAPPPLADPSLARHHSTGADGHFDRVKTPATVVPLSITASSTSVRPL